MSRIFLESDLQNLVNLPQERMDVEYKAWMDADDSVIRAKLARHIAALANHGGGFVVIGFEDKTHRELNDVDGVANKFHHDAVASIIKKYLTPRFECEVRLVQSASGISHPVIWVPPHGAVPIISKAAGPSDEKGRPQEIVEGKVYMRLSGPESVTVQSPEDWQSLIRRCVLHDRDVLLNQLLPVLRGQALAPEIKRDIFKEWHADAQRTFLNQLSAKNAPDLLKRSHIQFSYQVIRDDENELMPLAKLGGILEEVAHEVSGAVQFGWSAFYPFSVPGISPYSKASELFGEFLESSLLGDRDTAAEGFDHPDFWRVTPDGKATILKGYFSDRTRFLQYPDRQNPDPRFAPGNWLSPYFLAREVAEIVHHSRALALRFKSASSVRIACECFGLSKREIRDTERHYSPGRIARDDKRYSEVQWAVTTLAADWPDIVAEIVAPILRTFDPAFIIGADAIRNWDPTFRRF